MKKPNILLVSIDTLRADHVSSYGYHRKTTPNLDRFAEEGARFNNAYSTAVWTPPAHASMLTGLYPSAHKTVDYKSLSPGFPPLRKR
ncbi:MAG: sulfatase-like hydrolase/transferase [Calditrichia bacterium]